MNAINPPIHPHPERRKARINLAEIDADSEILSRKAIREEWVLDLAASLKIAGKLDPIICWQDAERPCAKLVILDGRHRAAAYRAMKRTSRVPAVILTCDRVTAFMIAAGVHHKGSIRPTRAEIADFAWAVVREVGLTRTALEIAAATGKNKRTIERMRSVWARMQREGREPTGSWYRDLKGDEQETGEMPDDPTEEELNEAAATIAKELRDVLDRRRKDAPLAWCEEVRLRALAKALGDETIRTLADYVFGGDDEWEEARGAARVAMNAEAPF